MTEDLLIVQVLGAVLFGLALGVITRWRGWPPFPVGLGAAGAYIVLWYVIGWANAGLPDSLGKLIAGSLLVLPGFLGFFGMPLCGAFALSYWASKRLGPRANGRLTSDET